MTTILPALNSQNIKNKTILDALRKKNEAIITQGKELEKAKLNYDNQYFNDCTNIFEVILTIFDKNSI